MILIVNRNLVLEDMLESRKESRGNNVSSKNYLSQIWRQFVHINHPKKRKEIKGLYDFVQIGEMEKSSPKKSNPSIWIQCYESRSSPQSKDHQSLEVYLMCLEIYNK